MGLQNGTDEKIEQRLHIPFDQNEHIKDVITDRRRKGEKITKEELILEFVQQGIELEKIIKKKDITFEQIKNLASV